MRRARSHDSPAEGPVTLGRERRGAITRRKNAAGLLFLFGLLTGGPLVTFDIQHSLGLVSMLGAGVASALVGYTATRWRERPMWAGRDANSNGTESLWRHGAAVR